jgi:hypothetical protein
VASTKQQTSEQPSSDTDDMKTAVVIAVEIFVWAAVLQLFLPRRLTNALVYCLCAWILARVRNSL